MTVKEKYEKYHSIKCDRCGKRHYSFKERTEYESWQQWAWSEMVYRGWHHLKNNDRQLSIFTGLDMSKPYLNFCPTCFYREMFNQYYNEYYESEYFQKLKRIRHTRDGYRCIKCGTAKNLQAHHTSYDHMGDPENELNDLVTCCHSCHEEIHAVDLMKEKLRKK